MSKREHARISSGGDTHDLRPKRRRESGETGSEVDVTMTEATRGGGANGVNGKAVYGDGLSLKEASLKLWQTVRDAVKDGRPLADNFLKKPPKKLYPDYYQLIQHPIAFDDIKRKIEYGQYPTLEGVKDDFDLCFDNAKDYNLKESVIWLDAQYMQKLAHKTYGKLVGGEEDGEKKTPSLSKLIKARLEKVVAKTDEYGRVLSEIFMELPSRKEWPSYYTLIKKPECLNNIFKRIKRKEYSSAAAFSADVELVFSNAMTFNEEHSVVWEDARILRDYFRQLMADMPAPYNVPEPVTKSTKIKIKPPQPAQASSSTSYPMKSEHPSLTLRVPAHPPKQPKQPAPAPSQTPASAPSASTSKSNPNVLPSTSKPAPQPPAPAKPTPKSATPATPAAANKPIAPLPSTSAIQAHKSGSTAHKPAVPRILATPKPAAAPAAATAPATQNLSFINATSSHYPHVAYHPTPTPVVSTPQAATGAVTTPVAATPPILRTSSAVNTATPTATSTAAQSPAPAPPLPLNHQLKSVSLRIQPKGRALDLDNRDGVKSWAVRLVKGESSIVVSNVKFMEEEGDEGEGSEGEEGDGDVEKHEEEEEDMDVDEEHNGGSAGRNGRTRSTSKRRGRGRPPKSASAAPSSSSAVAGTSSIAAAAKANAQTKAAAAAKAAAAKKKGATTNAAAGSSSTPAPPAAAAVKIGELQCKVNGVVVKEMADQPGSWNVLIPVGHTSLEVGQPNGMFWKVYVDRPV